MLIHCRCCVNVHREPIVSCSGSLLHGLGVWVDRKLQEVAQNTISYFKNTLELKKQLLKLNLPTNARLFTANAVSMYTNIPTHTALNLIGKHLAQYQRKHNNKYPKDAVRAGLRLIMTMNIFTFGDLTLKHLNGTAMGAPPAPPYATIYYGIHEEKFLPHHAQRVIFYRRFIDDVIGKWCPNKNHERDALDWNEFKDKMNAFPGLTWEFSERAQSIDFMDMTISINNSNKLKQLCLKKDSTYTCTSLHTPPTHQAYSLVLCTVLCFEFLPYVQTKRINYNKQRLFLNASLPVATEATIFGHCSTRQSRVQKHTTVQHQLRTTTTTASSSTYRFIQMIPNLPISKQPGEHT